jgi:hypothetical protein
MRAGGNRDRELSLTVLVLIAAAAVRCSPSDPLRTQHGGSNPDAGPTGTAGQAYASSGIAGDNETGVGGTTGAGGVLGAGATGGAAAAPEIAGTAGSEDTTGTGGTTGIAGTVGTAGAGGFAGAPDSTGAAGTIGGADGICLNSTVITPGGSEANCPAKNTWQASAMPTPPSMLDGIPDTFLQPQYAIDGDTLTRYSSGATMEDGFYFQVDLGAAALVSGITVDTSENADSTDVADGYEVGLSLDGVTFATVARCSFNAAPLEIINFPATAARYVRYTNKGAPGPGNGPISWLSIHELDVICN